MQSATHRSVTVVTILTLIFGSVFNGHNWVLKLIGRSTETKVVQCEQGKPCRAREHVVEKVLRP